MMIVHFSELFTLRDGIITPKVHVLVNGISLGPGISFGKGITFGGINLSELTEDYLEIEKSHEGVVTIKGRFCD